MTGWKMLGDWDWLVIVGVVVFAAGLWLLWGPGAALLAIGTMLIVAGVGGAMKSDRRSDGDGVNG